MTFQSNQGLLREIHTPLRVIIPNTESKFVEVLGLWDTGASGSAITKRVVEMLGLIPTGVANVQTAGGIFQQNLYTIDIALPNNVLINGIVASELDGVVGADSDVLIGMDIITLGDFAITNFGGRTCMSFRVPSCESIDFGLQSESRVVSAVPQRPSSHNPRIPQPSMARDKPFPGTGRNVPCPCGSGKKYKQCHGR